MNAKTIFLLVLLAAGIYFFYQKSSNSLIIICLFALYLLIDNNNNTGASMEHFTADQTEAIQNIASMYNNGVLTATNVNITGNLTVNGNTSLRGDTNFGNNGQTNISPVGAINASSLDVDGPTVLGGGTTLNNNVQLNTSQTNIMKTTAKFEIQSGQTGILQDRGGWASPSIGQGTQQTMNFRNVTQ